MKKIVLIGAIALLSGCATPAPEPIPEETRLTFAFSEAIDVDGFVIELGDVTVGDGKMTIEVSATNNRGEKTHYEPLIDAAIAVGGVQNDADAGTTIGGYIEPGLRQEGAIAFDWEGDAPDEFTLYLGDVHFEPVDPITIQLIAPTP